MDRLAPWYLAQETDLWGEVVRRGHSERNFCLFLCLGGMIVVAVYSLNWQGLVQRIFDKIRNLQYLTDHIVDEMEFIDTILKSSEIKSFIKADFSSDDVELVLRTLERRILISISRDSSNRKVGILFSTLVID